ncbi:MAG: beta-propeller fold lactonase family protein [bacterium]|nr:beta-propeller fold lactonase family protein [bacterium]
MMMMMKCCTASLLLLLIATSPVWALEGPDSEVAKRISDSFPKPVGSPGPRAQPNTPLKGSAGGPRWDATGSLTDARQQHTATLLLSGKVLVAGGVVGDKTLVSAELYDPATGTWQKTGSLTTARALHTATLLPSGKVLVAGGCSEVFDTECVASLSSAELYDPATGAWDVTGDLNEARRFHTATLLPSGKVLVAGGLTGPENPTSSVELYHPATGTWDEIADKLSEARWSHTATLLLSGNVLVAGGCSEKSDNACQSELYNSTDETWEETDPLNEARRLHTATLLPSGEVLVAGGCSEKPDNACQSELYNPTDKRWKKTSSLNEARRFHTATLLPSGKLLVAGGQDSAGTSIFSAELYSLNWKKTAELAVNRQRHTATLLPSGKVLLVGGATDLSLSSAELYDPAAGTWDPAESKKEVRWSHTATLLPSGEVLVAGGCSIMSDNGCGARVSSADLYHPTDETWATTVELNKARGLHTATLLPSGEVLVAGGICDSPRRAELYSSQTWKPTARLTHARKNHTATLLLSGRVLVVGGCAEIFAPGCGTPLSSAEVYDPDETTWTPTTPLETPRAHHTATLLPSGKVLVAGGIGDAHLSSAELYDPVRDIWTPTAPLASARENHTATLLSSGKVLVAGGTLGDAILRSAELYDPATGTWASAGDLTNARAHHTATLLPAGKVLVAGGRLGDAHLTSAELYDPATGTWTSADDLVNTRSHHSATLLPSGEVLVGGGFNGSRTRLEPELYSPDDYPEERRPVISEPFPQHITYGNTTEITGERFRGYSEASGGNGSANSAVNYPLIRMTPIEGGHSSWLVPDTWEDPVRLEIRDLPPTLHPGWYHLRVITAGIPSASKLVEVTCSLEITGHPESKKVAIGSSATFTVETQGGRFFQWLKDGVPIPGATGPSYSTPPIIGDDSGTQFQVLVDSGCMKKTSDSALLRVEDNEPPEVKVVSPSSGEFWLLSEPDEPLNTEVITWTMSDNVRICRVEVMISYSNDGGASYQLLGGAPLVSKGPGGPCRSGEEPTVTNQEYIVPTDHPSGTAGSLYKISVRVIDHALQEEIAESNFYIVRPNPDSVKTLILSNIERMKSKMGITPQEVEGLETKLQELADHPRVLGRVVDLNGVGTTRYDAWDADPSDRQAANNVLFGEGGIHDHILELLTAFPGVEYLVLVGDDRIIPLARLEDSTALYSESNYPEKGGGQLIPEEATVLQALKANQYLSDDPFAVSEPVDPEQLNGRLRIPDLAVGRLVENPDEIITAVATFISQDGVLDLSTLDQGTGHKVLVTGYDFLLDSGKRIRERWKNALGVSLPHDDNSLAPVDGMLLGQDWDESDESDESTLLEHLCGNDASPYAISSLNGHATHYEVGTPEDSFSIHGLDAADIADANACGNQQPLSLAGGVMYAVGCHGGLPVAGKTDTSSEKSLDLPQTMLSRGALAYVANTGYGWGLRHGVGYGERLVEILTQEITRGGTVVIGDAVKRTKLRYFLESRRFDPYDEKSLMQWTFFGLPMYAVRTGIDRDGTARGRVPALFEGPPPKAGERPAVERFGAVSVERVPAPKQAALPRYLTQLNLHFDFTVEGAYRKYRASGEVLDEPGCPTPAPSEGAEGCYYTLNGLATGETDLPIQPYFIYDSRLSGTSQHGVLWKGGVYEEEAGWVPVFGELISNGGDGSNHGVAPRKIFIPPDGRRRPTGGEDPECQPSDLEMNSLVVPAGEALKQHESDQTYSMERRYREVDLEVFYFNNTQHGSGNCDRDGPELLAGPYHLLHGSTIEWAVPVADAGSVWRVVVVYTDGTVDEENRGAWSPLELADDGTGTWRGESPVFPDSARVTYVIQAVDRSGNVTWLDYVPLATAVPHETAASSGVDIKVPMPVDVLITQGVAADLSVSLSDTPDPVRPLESLRYTIRVNNAGPDPATSVSVSGELPEGVTLERAEGEGWSCSKEDRWVTCTRRRLAEHQEAPPITLEVIAPDVRGKIEYDVSVTAIESETYETDPQSTFVSRNLSFVETARDGIHADGLDGAASVALSPDGKHVYVAGSTDNAVAVFLRGGTRGSLIFVDAYFNEVDDMDGLAGATSVTLSPDGEHVYVASSTDHAVVTFTRNETTGALRFGRALFNQLDGDGFAGASSVTVSSDGRHVYVTGSLDDAVAVFEHGEASGELTFLDAVFDGVNGVEGLDGAAAVAISPDDQHVYVTSVFSQALVAFLRKENGLLELKQVLEWKDGVKGLEYPESLVVSSDGKHVYTGSSSDGVLAAFERNEVTGELGFVGAWSNGVGGVEGLGGARSVTVSPDGDHVYVASPTDGALAAFERVEATGALRFVEALFGGEGGVEGLEGARSVAVSPDGDHVYVAGELSDGGAVTVFERIHDKTCLSGPTNLCLNNRRFKVELYWQDSEGNSGAGRAVPFGSDKSGLLWFFAADNWEMLVKVLDGCASNNHFWVMAAAATNVEYTLRVTDTVTGEMKSYSNSLGNRAETITDTAAFATCPAAGSTIETSGQRDALGAEGFEPFFVQDLGQSKQGGCTLSSTELCLSQGRFRAEVNWRDYEGNTGSGEVVPFSSDQAGVFWFLDADNWEMLIKVIDGCQYNDRFWVFLAAPTNIEYTLSITDTETGAVREYFNPLGRVVEPIMDNEAFATCHP